MLEKKIELLRRKLNDSKKISEKKRLNISQKLDKLIVEKMFNKN